MSVCNQPPRSTQPGHPSMGRWSEYQQKLGSRGGHHTMHCWWSRSVSWCLAEEMEIGAAPILFLLTVLSREFFTSVMNWIHVVQKSKYFYQLKHGHFPRKCGLAGCPRNLTVAVVAMGILQSNTVGVLQLLTFRPTAWNFRQPKNFRLLQQLGGAATSWQMASNAAVSWRCVSCKL